MFSETSTISLKSCLSSHQRTISTKIMPFSVLPAKHQVLNTLTTGKAKPVLQGFIACL